MLFDPDKVAVEGLAVTVGQVGDRVTCQGVWRFTAAPHAAVVDPGAG